MNRSEIVEQTKLAFDFIQRLYLETSYCIKEMEGILKKEEEEFQILRPSGYSVSTRSSVGLESTLVEQWLLKKAVVGFAAKSHTNLIRGQTVTKFLPGLRIIVVRFALYDKDLLEPEVWAGIVSDIVQKKEYSKFEYYMLNFAYSDKKMFQNLGESEYEDSDWTIKLNLIKRPLYDISNTEDIQRKIIEPVLRMYKGK